MSQSSSPKGCPMGLGSIGSPYSEKSDFDESAFAEALPGSEDELRKALLASEARHRAILDTAVNAIITISERGIIESVNVATERMFGYAREEMIGRNVAMLMPRPYTKMHDNFLSNYTTTGVKKVIGIGRETIAMRKDGSIFPMDVSVGEVNLPQGRLFTGIIRDISDRKELEQKILSISEEEQQRIGQDLHDDLCQQLAAIGCLAKVAASRLSRENSEVAESITEIVSLVSQANVRAREMSRGLVPVVLDVDGLMGALRDLAQRTKKIYEVNCRFSCPEPVHVDNNSMSIQLYRIAQEGVGNAVRHSRAKNVELRLTAETTMITLEIRDDGIGMPETSGANRSTGMGLLTMAHRAKMLGGELHIESHRPKGTRIKCVIPIA